jgi:hypothetical protein
LGVLFARQKWNSRGAKEILEKGTEWIWCQSKEDKKWQQHKIKKNTQVEDFLDEEGIKHGFLAPYTP